MVRISTDDQRWASNVLMPYFHIRALRLRADPSTKKWPDLWCRTGADGIPAITVTAEWARQNADERRKRLVHEALHIAYGYEDNIRPFGAELYSTYPEKDEYSRMVYRLVQQWARDRADFAQQRRMKEAVKLLGKPMSKVAYRKEMEDRGVKLDEYDLGERKSGTLLRNPDPGWHRLKARDAEMEADNLSPGWSDTPTYDKEGIAQAMSLDRKHRTYYLSGKSIGHFDSAEVAESHPSWWQDDRTFHRDQMKHLQKELRDVVAGSSGYSREFTPLRGSYLKGLIDAHRESRKEMWDRYRSWRSRVNPRRRAGPRKAKNLYEQFVVELAGKWDWNSIVQMLRDKQANMVRAGIRVKPRYYLGNQMEIGPEKDYWEPVTGYSAMSPMALGGSYTMYQWFSALIDIAGLHGLSVFRASSDPADVYVEPGVPRDFDIGRMAAEVADLVGEDYVRNIQSY